jgi:hypothetical protein
MNDENQQAETGTGDNQSNETPAVTETAAPAPAIDPAAELAALKQRAKLMGISHSGNIGLEALRAKVNAKINGQPDPTVSANAPAEPEAAQTNELNPLAGDTAGAVPARKKTLRQQQMEEQMKLVRCRIQNLDPRKKDLPGEIFCVGNEIIGTVRKYVPYGEVTDNGYHLPYILYNELNSRKFLNIRTKKNRLNGQIIVETGWAKEFALEVLPQLTQEELNRLATAQAASGSIDNGGA